MLPDACGRADMTPPPRPTEIVRDRVERLIREVHQIRMMIWDREWAGGRHGDAPDPPRLP